MEDALEKLMRWVQLGLLSAFGGAAAYVYTLSTHKTKFRWFGFAANLFLAFFAGCMAGHWIPSDAGTSEYRDGLVMAVGFCAYPILALLERTLPALFVNGLIK